jgi:cell division protein FtsI (penicillin-binding protein 3)
LAETRLSKTRLFAIFSFFLLALFALLVRLGFLQIQNSKLLSLAKNQSRVMIEMQPARGRIVDREGREFALDVRLGSLYAVSRDIKNKDKVARQLSIVLERPYAEILAKLQKDKLFVWIARKLPAAKVEAVKKLKLEGIGFIKESMRAYPMGETACHLIGFTDIDNNGLEGIELHYNSFLKGVPGWRLGQRDAKQRELISKEVEQVPPVDGFNIHLTIDEVIQSITDKVLAETCEKFNAVGGSIIVMDPKTGDVLALSNYPVYDPNNARKSKVEDRRNRVLTDIFEPGSVFKSFTLSSILENKAVSLDEKFDCEQGSWKVAGKILHDHHGSGVLSLREVIEKSSNIGTVKATLRLGGDKLYKTIKAFGFGDRTGIGLAGEVGGIAPNPRNWSRSSIINIPIGQGIAVTSIQLASAVGAIANDGVLMKPRIISHIDDQDGRVIQSYAPEPVRQAISKETSLQVRSVLEGVVSRGTGKKAAVPGFKAAGKTGTAQKLLPNGTYSHDHFVASFVGFVPYDEPKLVMAVSIDEPHPVIFGGDVAAPAFSRVASAVLGYWEVAATEAPPEVVRSAKNGIAKKAAKPAGAVTRPVQPQNAVGAGQ